MNRHLLLATALCASLLGGCAATAETPLEESELATRVRQELALDPLLNTSQVTVTERDGQIVLGGFVDELEDLDAIRETIEGLDGVTNIENNVIVQSGG